MIARETKTLLTFIVLLGGCASVADLERRPPDGRYVSRKPVPELARCVSDSLRSIGNPSTASRDGEARITLRNQAGYAQAVVILRSVNGGSTVSVRQPIAYNLGPPIERCL